ncbi:MAG: response regulator transcription factor [Solirubrobacteraceae bacterium]
MIAPTSPLPFTVQPRCGRCHQVIGVYEPAVMMVDGIAQRASRAADPALTCVPGNVERYHLACSLDSQMSPEPGNEAPPNPIRVVIADDHAVVRRGLRQLLEAEGGFEVVAEASTTEDARRYLRGHHPDVLVLDLNMPEGSSLRAVPEIRAEAPSTAIVVLTMQDEPAYARQALAAGVLGYVLKEAADAELVEAVRRAAAGQGYLNPRLGARVAAAPPPGPPDGLSERELEVLRLIALGHTNARIAEQLFLSVRTVETHRSHIQQKLRLGSRADLVGYALDHGLIAAHPD